MKAYHSDPELKSKLILELEKHKAADAIVRGIYGRTADNTVQFKGCAVGCTLHSLGATKYGEHGEYERLLGIPRVIARIQNGLFENLSDEDAKEFPLQFAHAIPVGADLSQVADKFLLAVLSDSEHGAINFTDDTTRSAVQTVIEMYQRRIAGDNPSIKDWDAVAAAYAAADAYAYAAADAAYADADAAAYAARFAAARAAYYRWMRDTLIKLLQEAPIAVAA